jgi:hypothetical protein
MEVKVHWERTRPCWRIHPDGHFSGRCRDWYLLIFDMKNIRSYDA